MQSREQEKGQAHSALILCVPHGPLLGQQGIMWVGKVKGASLGIRRLEARFEAAGGTPGSEEGQWGLGTEWPLWG